MRTLAHTSLLRGALVLIAAALFAASVLPATAAPSNAAIRKKRSQAVAAESKMHDLADKLELRGEELAEIEAAVAKTRREIAATEAELVQANSDLERSQDMLDRRASTIYRNGSVSVMSVLVGASDFGDLVNRLDLMRRIGDSDAAMVASVKDAKARVEASKKVLETRQQEQVALRAEARHKADQVSDALEEQQSYVASLKSDLKKLIEKERKRQEAIKARLRADAQARARAIARRANRTFSGELGSPHPEVVSIAERYLGVPYVWGGTTPSGFDCSGLVQYCYRQIGISIPRTSRVQFQSGDYIPPDRMDLLQPGDLVFFGYGGDPNQVHHVGMWIGDGMMIEAPYTGARVRRASLIARINSRGDYVGATRP